MEAAVHCRSREGFGTGACTMGGRIAQKGLPLTL
jgi:hypothetical protein